MDPKILRGGTAEEQRLEHDAQRVRNWKRWGPYLSERQWATVREDYSAEGNSWNYFPHDHARSRAYRWGEDGLLGITDRQCRLCFALALWNGTDPILKERLFGLTGPEGNHGEDVKELYYYLDSTPTHSYMKALYKYPQAEYPYGWLIEENRRRGLGAPEFELIDTGLFHEDRYFDVFVEYAKASENDILIRLTMANRGPEKATLHLLPTLWFRNTWSWGEIPEECTAKPLIALKRDGLVHVHHDQLGDYQLAYEGDVTPLFTENETNSARLHGYENPQPFVKDAFHDHVVSGRTAAVNPELTGTKFAPHYVLEIEPGKSHVVRLRLSAVAGGDDAGQTRNEAARPPGSTPPATAAFADFDQIFAQRMKDADEFYDTVIPSEMDQEAKKVARQGYAGLLWSKQFYNFVIRDWLAGDPMQPPPPPERKFGRNHEWMHLFNRDIISMPDKWEYPWFAAWDLAFHMIPFSKIDPHFAKSQLILFLREWYMHPNGQIPAYEFSFGDVNPPVHAWAAWRVYKMTGPRGERDTAFLESVFQKLLLNFTWWVNRKDAEGNNIFSAGFLGLDNIGVFDRSKPLPTGGFLQQADGTAWMGFYCLTMLSMAIELAETNPVYEDMASKFFEHFIGITDAMNSLGGSGLWDEDEGFYYDQLKVDDQIIPLRTRSLVGLLPLIAVENLETDKINKLPGFKKRMEWFLNYRKDLDRLITYCETCPSTGNRMLAIPTRERLQRALRYMLDENEFLSPHGLRSLSRIHRDKPYVFTVGDEEYRVDYVPGEAASYLFGGNSNWRGPIWFPINFLIVEALERYHLFFGEGFKVECPVGSGKTLTLKEVAQELSRRLASIFLPDENGMRPCHGGITKYESDPHWRDLVLFHEYFHGETGRGCGASHQTGWTALAVKLLENTVNGSDRNKQLVEKPRARRPNYVARLTQGAPNLLPAFLVLGILLWIFTMTGGRQVFVKEILGEAYDSQAEHLLRGDPGVEYAAIRHEALTVNGKTRMYFGPAPAFVRIPLNFVYPNGRGYWSRICGFCAGMIALAAFAGVIRMALRSSQLSPAWQNWLGNACLVGFALASPLLLLLGNLSIYDEAIIWGLAWSLAALYFAFRSRTAEGAVLTWCLVGFSLSAAAALLSRATFGAPLLLIAPLLALRLFHRNPIRNLAALFLPLGAAFVFHLFLTYAKFGDFSGMPLRYSLNSVQREFALKHGLFHPERVPYSFADYFILRRPELQHDPPFLKARRQAYNHPTLYVMPFTETYSSLLWCSSWILLGAVIGVAMLLRPGGSDWVDRGIAAILFLQAIAILSFMGLAQRYTAEFFPFLVFTFLFFLERGRAAFHLRYLLIGLVAVSVVINSLTTVSWLLEADMNVPAETRAKWNEFLGRPSRR